MGKQSSLVAHKMSIIVIAVELKLFSVAKYAVGQAPVNVNIKM